MSRWILVLAMTGAMCAGCATAEGGGVDSGGDDDDVVDSGNQPQVDAANQPQVDAANQPQPDAYVPPQPDANVAPTPITISQSTSQTITEANSVACQDANYYDTANSYYRVFDLSSYGITGPFSITSVDFGIESAVGGTGSQQVTVKLHTLSGAVSTANLTQLASQSYTVTDQALTIINVPITATAPAGSTLVVEFAIPDGTTALNALFIGSNALGESGPTYLSAADCGFADMTTNATIGYPDMHFVMNVNGTH